MSISQIIQSIGSMSEADLRKLNSITIAELRNRHDRKVFEARCAFNVGDQVYFDSKRGGRQVGHITKLNQKTIEVRVGHVNWKVTASLLKKVGA